MSPLQYPELYRYIVSAFQDANVGSDDTLKSWACEIQCLKEFLEQLVSLIWGANGGIFHWIFAVTSPLGVERERDMLVVDAFEGFGVFLGISSFWSRRCECCDTYHLP